MLAKLDIYGYRGTVREVKQCIWGLKAQISRRERLNYMCKLVGFFVVFFGGVAFSTWLLLYKKMFCLFFCFLFFFLFSFLFFAGLFFPAEHILRASASWPRKLINKVRHQNQRVFNSDLYIKYSGLIKRCSSVQMSPTHPPTPQKKFLFSKVQFFPALLKHWNCQDQKHTILLIWML